MSDLRRCCTSTATSIKKRSQSPPRKAFRHSICIPQQQKNEGKMNRISALICIFLSAIGTVGAFAPVSSNVGVTRIVSSPSPQSLYQPAALQRQRQSMAQVQTMGLFGLGAPEIGVILVAAAFLLGPEKLAELGKDAGKIAGELKEVPKEFQEGMKEGEAQAKAMKAKLDTDEPAE